MRQSYELQAYILFYYFHIVAFVKLRCFYGLWLKFPKLNFGGAEAELRPTRSSASGKVRIMAAAQS